MNRAASLAARCGPTRSRRYSMRCGPGCSRKAGPAIELQTLGGGDAVTRAMIGGALDLACGYITAEAAARDYGFSE